MQNVEQTIISQYATSPTLVQLIQNINGYIDPAANINAFYDLVWNVLTAQGYGLDVWGRIVAVSRILTVGTGDAYFGFQEGEPSWTGFGQAPFYSGQPTSGNYALSDSGFRTLILAKALANITDGSIPSLNQLLLNLFPGRGNVYVTDGEDMTMTYTFTFTPTLVEQGIIISSGVMPRPAGVAVSVVLP